ncbi:MAG: rhodanese-like domain-containing protein [Planctomycetota bacterium]|nr:rhodanese-like domain-containing protein [Planctomycetota bacterium]
MQPCRTLIVGLALAGATLALSGLGGCEKGTSGKDINESVIYTLADVREAIGRRADEEPEHALLIDPRAPKYYAVGHLPGAVNLRLPDVREDDPRDHGLQKFDRLIVYGENPGSAVARAMFKRLLATGYGGVKFYAGGLDEWMLSGGEIEASELPPTEEE